MGSSVFFRFDDHRLKHMSSRERRFIWFHWWVYSKSCTEPLFFISYWQTRKSKTRTNSRICVCFLIKTIESSTFNDHATKHFDKICYTVRRKVLSYLVLSFFFALSSVLSCWLLWNSRDTLEFYRLLEKVPKEKIYNLQKKNKHFQK